MIINLINSIPVILILITIFVLSNRTEIILAFVYCGVMQNLLYYYCNFKLVIDYPVIAFIAIMLDFFKHLIVEHGSIHVKPMIIKAQLLFVLLLLTGLFWRVGGYFDLYKPFLIFLATGIIPFFYFSVLVPNFNKLKRFIIYLGIFSIIGSLTVFPSALRYKNLSEFHGASRAVSFMIKSGDITMNNILLARQVGHAIIFLIFAFLFFRQKWVKTICFAFFLVLLFVIVTINERGPLYGLLLVLLSLIIISRLCYFPIFKRISKIQIIILIVITFYFASRFIHTYFYRLEEVLYSPDRLRIFKNAVELFFLHPILGWGYGYANVGVGSTSAHNLFLELAVDTGIVGVVIICWSLFFSIRIGINMIKKIDNIDLKYLVSLIITMFFYDILQSMVSGGLNPSAILWIEMGIITAFYINLRKNVYSKQKSLRRYPVTISGNLPEQS